MRSNFISILILVKFCFSSIIAFGLPAELEKVGTVTIEPSFIQFINGLFARELGKSVEIGAPKEKIDKFKKSIDLEPLFLLHADFGDLIQGDFLGFVTSIFSCNNYIYRNKVEKTRIGFDLAQLELLFRDNDAEVPGYAIVVRLENVFVKGLFENHTEWYEFNCTDTKLPWRLEKSYIQFEIPLIYNEGEGFVVGAIKHDFPTEWVGSVEFGTVNMNDLIIDYLMVEYLEDLIDTELGDTPNTGLNADIQKSFREQTIKMQNSGLNVPNPVQSGLTDLIAEFASAPIVNLELSAVNDAVYFESERATITASVVGSMQGAILPTCLEQFAPTAGAGLNYVSPAPIVEADVTARLSLKIFEWNMDQIINSGLLCFKFNDFNLEAFVDASVFNLVGIDEEAIDTFADIDVVVTDARLRHDYVAGGPDWQNLENLRLEIDVRSSVQVDLSVYNDLLEQTLHHSFTPYILSSTLIFPVNILLNDAKHTLELQVDPHNFTSIDAIDLDVSMQELDIDEATTQQLEFIRASVVERLGRLHSNVSIATFTPFEANGGIYFCEALDKDTEDPNDTAWFINCPELQASPQLNFNYGNYFAALSELKVNENSELLLGFLMNPALPPSPPKSFIVAEPIEEGLQQVLEEGGLVIVQTPNNGDPLLGNLRLASSVLEYPYLPKMPSYRSYFVHNGRDAVRLREAIANSSNQGRVHLLTGLNGNDSYQIYTRSNQLAWLAGEEKNCIESITLFAEPPDDLAYFWVGGFYLSEQLIKPKRKSRFASQDALSAALCSQASGGLFDD